MPNGYCRHSLPIFCLYVCFQSASTNAADVWLTKHTDVPPEVSPATMSVLTGSATPLNGPDLSVRLSKEYQLRWQALDDQFRQQRRWQKYVEVGGNYIPGLVGLAGGTLGLGQLGGYILRQGFGNITSIATDQFGATHTELTNATITYLGIYDAGFSRTIQGIYNSTPKPSNEELVNQVLREISARDKAVADQLESALRSSDATQRNALINKFSTQIAADVQMLANISLHTNEEIEKLKKESERTKKQAALNAKNLQILLAELKKATTPDCDTRCEIKKKSEEVRDISTGLEQTFAMTGSKDGARAMRFVSLAATVFMGFASETPQGYIAGVNALLGMRQLAGGGGGPSAEEQLLQQIQEVYEKLSKQIEDLRQELIYDLTTVNHNVVAIYEFQQARYRENSYVDCLDLVPKASFPAAFDLLVTSDSAKAGFLLIGTTGRYQNQDEIVARLSNRAPDLQQCFNAMNRVAALVNRQGLKLDSDIWLLNPQEPISERDAREDMLLYDEIDRAESVVKQITSNLASNSPYKVGDLRSSLLSPRLSFDKVNPTPSFPVGTPDAIVENTKPISPEFVDRWTGYALGTHYLQELFDVYGRKADLGTLQTREKPKDLLTAARTLLDVAIYQQSLLTGVGLVPIAHGVLICQEEKCTKEWKSFPRVREALLGISEDVSKGPVRRDGPKRLIDNMWFRYNFALYGVLDAIRQTKGSSALAYEFAYYDEHPELLGQVLGAEWMKKWTPVWKKEVDSSSRDYPGRWELTLNGRKTRLPSPRDVSSGRLLAPEALTRLMYLRDRVQIELAGFGLDQNQRKVFWNALHSGIDLSGAEY